MPNLYKLMAQALLPGALVALLIGIAASKGVATEERDARAVEATIQSFEQAVQDFDLDKANSLLAPGARWIEYSPPAKLDEFEWPRINRLKVAGVRIAFRLRDFRADVEGDVAWTTLTLEGVFSSNTPEGKKLLQPVPGRCSYRADTVNCKATFVESEVLIRTASGWRIALGHTSELPRPQGT